MSNFDNLREAYPDDRSLVSALNYIEAALPTQSDRTKINKNKFFCQIIYLVNRENKIFKKIFKKV